jgi:hypothetical protein|tara:strand:- start:17575 stop:17730 length:156 start_codon:yes stop_codon:yes gene_type:complete
VELPVRHDGLNLAVVGLSSKTIIADFKANGNVTFVNFGAKLPTNEEFALAA